MEVHVVYVCELVSVRGQNKEIAETEENKRSTTNRSNEKLKWNNRKTYERKTKAKYKNPNDDLHTHTTTEN